MNMITGVKNKVETLLNQAVDKHKLGQKEAAIDLYLKSLELDKNLQDWVYEKSNYFIISGRSDFSGIELRGKCFKNACQFR